MTCRLARSTQPSCPVRFRGGEDRPCPEHLPVTVFTWSTEEATDEAALRRRFVRARKADR